MCMSSHLQATCYVLANHKDINIEALSLFLSFMCVIKMPKASVKSHEPALLITTRVMKMCWREDTTLLLLLD